VGEGAVNCNFKARHFSTCSPGGMVGNHPLTQVYSFGRHPATGTLLRTYSAAGERKHPLDWAPSAPQKTTL
jgi:hypothetical protein